MRLKTAVYRRLIIFLIVLSFILGIGFVTLTFAHAPQAHQGPIPPIADGYGRWGDHPVISETFQMTSSGYTNTVALYYPQNQTAPAPTLFFAVGWDIPCGAYAEFLRFFASKGYTAVCAEYGTDTDSIGTQLSDAFIEAASRYPTRIDTDKFGLAGHSSGGGLLPSVGYNLVRNEGWGGVDGQNVFIFSSAPWFDFDITDAMLLDYPAGMKLILHTYEDDYTTDLRTYIDQFESLTAIPDTEKEYITLRPSEIDSYVYLADHRVIATGGSGYGAYDALDDYGVFRLVEALADYTFNGSADGKLVALGDGSDEQIEMGALRDLVSTDDPRPIPGETYDYPCDVDYNPRRAYCDDFDHELPAAVLISPAKHITLDDESPVFVWEPVVTAVRYDLQVRPLLPNGDPDWSVSYGVDDVTAVAANCENETQNCAFLLPSALPDGEYVWWIRPENDEKQGVWSRRGYFDKARLLYLPVVISQ